MNIRPRISKVRSSVSERYFYLPQWPELEKQYCNTDVAAATAIRERVKALLEKKIATEKGYYKRLAKERLEVLSRLTYAETILDIKKGVCDLSPMWLEIELDWTKPERPLTYGEEKFGDNWRTNM